MNPHVQSAHDDLGHASHATKQLDAMPNIAPDYYYVDSNSSQRMQGKWADIWGGFAAVTLPVLALNVAVIATIAQYAEPGSLERFRAGNDLHVDISPTTFTVITSLASTFVTISVGFMTLLAAYPASRKMAEAIRDRTGKTTTLPTPYQLAMMLEIRAGGVWRAALRLLTYTTSNRKKRAPITPPLQTLASVMLTGIVLSGLVCAADTWLHLATKPTNIFRYSPSPGTNLSFSVLDRCLKGNNSYNAQSEVYNIDQPDDAEACTLLISAGNAFLVPSPIEPIVVVNNLSSQVTAKRHFATDRTYVYLSPADTEKTLRQDYTAFTYAMSTMCAPKSSGCFDKDDFVGSETPFNCTQNGFEGQVLQNFQTRYYPDEALKDQSFESGYLAGLDNPFHFIGVAGLSSSWPLPTKDPEILKKVGGEYTIAMNCTTTVYDVAYRVKNRTVTAFDAVKSNMSITNALQGPIAYNIGALSAPAHAFSFAGLEARSAQQMLDRWALEYDHAAIGMGVVALRQSDAQEAKYRTSVLVSSIPVAPLVCLLVANMLFCIAGAVLAFMAVVSTKDPETQEVVGRLSIVGLTAERFEGDQARVPVEDVAEMYLELTQARSCRVGVGRDFHGGYSYYSQ